MYFTETPSLWEIEKAMKMIPNFTPRGHGVVILCKHEFAEKSCIGDSQKEILARTVSRINNPLFQKRFQKYINESETIPMNFRNSKHSISFTDTIRKKNKKDYALMSALYLLTAEFALWQTATLKRGDLTVTKTSEDGLTEGVKFHLSGTSLSGLPVDEYAVTDSSGTAHFEDMLIGSGYVLSEVDTGIQYVVPDDQTAAVEWNKVTEKSFRNILKKWNAAITKSDSETGTAQGDASLAGAVYGVYKGDQLIDTYTTDSSGQFVTKYGKTGRPASVMDIDTLLDDEDFADYR